MKSEVKNQLSPLEEFASEVIEEKFESLAKDCRYKFIDDEGRANCNYRQSSVGFCRVMFCPRLSEEVEENEVR